MPIEAASWYDRDPEPSSFYQGDVLNGVPVVFMPPVGDGAWILLRPDPQHPLEQVLRGQTPRTLKPHAEISAPNAWGLGTELVLAKAVKVKIIVITQTCDLAHRNYVQVAPVFPESGIEDSEKRTSLEINEIGSMFFLPSAPTGLTENSYAELDRITSVHKSYLRGANLVVRLSSAGRIHFQNHLANFHGRPFGFNTSDTVPQSGRYLCMNCAISGRIERLTLVVGAVCPPCSVCGQGVLWTKTDEDP